MDKQIKASEQKIAKLETQLDQKEAELKNKYGIKTLQVQVDDFKRNSQSHRGQQGNIIQASATFGVIIVLILYTYIYMYIKAHIYIYSYTYI